GAADAGEDDVLNTLERLELRQRRRLGGERGRGLAARVLSALHGDEGRAEAVEAGIVLVAARLVDRPLAAELGLQRLDRDAVRGSAAVAAAFADQRVDHHPLRRP